MTTYESWLTLVNTDTLMDYTNEQIIALPEELRPIDWFNPWLLGEEEVDKMRQDFKGGALKWSRFVEEKLPQLDPKLERQNKIQTNKQKDAERCGCEITWIDKKGLPRKGRYQCKHYDICPKCRANRQKQHNDRLKELQSKGCQFVEGQKKEMLAQFGKDTYTFKLPDGREITVIPKTDEPIGQSLTYQSMKQFNEISITGNRVSGNLGKEDQATGNPIESRQVAVTSHIIEASKEVEELIEAEFYKETKDFEPTDLDSLEKLLYRCNYIWLALAQKYCDKVHFLGRNMITITEFDLDWTDRKEYIKKWQEKVKKPAIA